MKKTIGNNYNQELDSLFKKEVSAELLIRAVISGYQKQYGDFILDHLIDEGVQLVEKKSILIAKAKKNRFESFTLYLETKREISVAGLMSQFSRLALDALYRSSNSQSEFSIEYLRAIVENKIGERLPIYFGQVGLVNLITLDKIILDLKNLLSQPKFQNKSCSDLIKSFI